MPLVILSVTGQFVTLLAGLLLVTGAGPVASGQSMTVSVVMVLAGSASVFGALAWRTEIGRTLALLGGAILTIEAVALAPLIGAGPNQLFLIGGFGLMVAAQFARPDEALF
jgi:hypothetical protein